MSLQSDNNQTICDEHAFDNFFKGYAKSLRNHLYYKFGDLDQAEDIVQEAFIKVWDNCSKIPVGKAKSYLYTVAVNLGTSLMRHNQVKFKYKNYITRRKSDMTNESPEFLLLEKEYMEKIKRAIASLPDRQREVYLLSRIEKKTYREIAEMSNVSIKAIEKLMHKALIKMRKEIGNV